MAQISITFDTIDDLSNEELKEMKEQIARVIIASMSGRLTRTGINVEQTTKEKKIKGKSNLNY